MRVDRLWLLFQACCWTAALCCSTSINPAQAQRPGELVLVQDGNAQVPIVLFPDAPPLVKSAAEDLAVYMEKISGARPAIIEGKPARTPETAIWIGYQPELTELFPETDFAFQHPEEILIQANADHLVIAGRDRWDPERMAAIRGDSREARARAMQQREYGTVNAVYTFLQEYLDVRWLWPGELGEDIVKQKTIAFAPFEHRHHPRIRGRSAIMRLSTLHRRAGHSEDWTRLQRLQLDSLGDVPGGHPASDWWDKYHEEHPEYFALQPDGTRSGFPAPKTAKRCKSNPDVWDRWLVEVVEAIKEDPDQTIFSAAANDSHSNGICVCENCRAWDPPFHAQGAAADPNPEGIFDESERESLQRKPAVSPPADAVRQLTFTYGWKGAHDDYVAMSDRYLRFANELGKKLKERFPERDDLYVKSSAYGPSTPPPVQTQPADNVIVSYVGHFPLTTQEQRAHQKKEFEAWGKTGVATYYRPNYWYWGGGLLGWPEVSFTQTAEDFRFLADNHVLGIFVDTSWEHWATQGPMYYLMAQLAWDPYQDAEAVMDDYYQRGFGNAADDIKTYWTMMEKAREEYMEMPGFRTGSRAKYDNVALARQVYDLEFFKQADRVLKRAAAQVETEPEVYAKRVAFVRSGFDFFRLVFESAEWMDLVRETKGADTQAVRQVSANWEKIERIAEESSPPGFRYSLIQSRMKEGYMGGMDVYFGPPSSEYREAAGLR